MEQCIVFWKGPDGRHRMCRSSRDHYGRHNFDFGADPASPADAPELAPDLPSAVSDAALVLASAQIKGLQTKLDEALETTYALREASRVREVYILELKEQRDTYRTHFGETRAELSEARNRAQTIRNTIAENAAKVGVGDLKERLVALREDLVDAADEGKLRWQEARVIAEAHLTAVFSAAIDAGNAPEKEWEDVDTSTISPGNWLEGTRPRLLADDMPPPETKDLRYPQG